jgi:hypothetical protein
MIGAANLSPVTKFLAGIGAVSRYDLSRSHEAVPAQDFDCGQMRALPNVAWRSWVSGCRLHYKVVLVAGTKAKTVTNNLPLLTVLWLVILFFSK